MQLLYLLFWHRVELFGELDKGVFEPHFYYGKVLLELERVQKGNLITEAIGGEDNIDEDTDSEEQEADSGTGTFFAFLKCWRMSSVFVLSASCGSVVSVLYLI